MSKTNPLIENVSQSGCRGAALTRGVVMTDCGQAVMTTHFLFRQFTVVMRSKGIQGTVVPSATRNTNFKPRGSGIFRRSDIEILRPNPSGHDWGLCNAVRSQKVDLQVKRNFRRFGRGNPEWKIKGDTLLKVKNSERV